ncbi:unnamed protein product [marine sediment metagenome]|uniref:Uncharacterized protein n=1 Tax=marine sediment metagenome TaxID=412755 RepID=X1GNW1_9ZZZZ
MANQEKLIDLVDKVKDNLLNIKVSYATIEKIGEYRGPVY